MPDKITHATKDEQEDIHWHVDKFYLEHGNRFAQARKMLREQGSSIHRRSE
jgi:hypothetical protein